MSAGRIIPLKQATAESPNESLFEVRRKIYPRAVHGAFATARWSMVWITQLVFYGLPWLTWNGRPAVLFDLAARKFYVFGLVLWPQDFIYLTALLLMSALSLFLFTAVAGRLWCGYACPQTVYTEIFLWIERVVEGAPIARTRLDAAPLSARKLAIKSAKHGAWIAVAAWTGLTFVGYFTPIRALAGEIASFSLGPWESFWIVFYGFATYGNAGWMREQVCKYMCPYARFQGAMFDRNTLLIGYDADRGEPRGARSRKATGTGLGDCIDCRLCVQVCPTGIDIRDGLQYECIGCAACIDACDQVMDKMGYARGLIRYSTEAALREHLGFTAIARRFVRPRTLIYASLLAFVVSVTLAALWLRVPLKLDVIRDRGALVRELADGDLENVFRLQVMNATEQAHRYRVSVEGLARIAVASDAEFTVDAAATHAVPLRLRVPGAELKPGSHPIRITVEAIDATGLRVTEKSVFLVR
jgi:cytochrome c oxidase accessory protein FixG